MSKVYDKDFLKQLDNAHSKEIYARVTSLTFEEEPIEQIEGKITGGSINKDGSSAVRRTCNLTLLAHDVNINEFYWGLTHKFKLEIGVVNNINTNYDNIIWFNMGIFAITSFTMAVSVNNYTITINGKDKMCLLNGDLGGAMTAQVDFANIESYDNQYTVKNFSSSSEYEAGRYYIKEGTTYALSYLEYDENTVYYELDSIYNIDALPIKYILREAVHTYAHEPYQNIILNDLETCGLELLEYRNNEDPMYLIYDTESQNYVNMTLNGNTPCQVKDAVNTTTLANLQDDQYYTRVDSLTTDAQDPALISFPNGSEDMQQAQYYVSKLTYGDTAGYRETDLTYAGELVLNVGEALTGLFDKIKTMLGDFEYFYDVDGKFIFQRQKTYTNNSWTNIVTTDDNDTLIENAAETSAVEYRFDDNNIITSFNNNPNLSNLKNDFSIWGEKEGLNGTTYPIHLRYAIDKKPTFYKSFDDVIYTTDSDYIEEVKTNKKVEITTTMQENLEAFELQYPILISENYTLQSPEKQSDGSWSAGWWDIRDWYNYYKLITRTDPNKTMKWYSSNDAEGCVKLNTVDATEESDKSVWLIIYNPTTDVINTQHGCGVYTGIASRTCTLYESTLNADGTITTSPVSPTETRAFVAPYSGCSDNHTYLHFLKEDVEEDGNRVYFYNPNFPSIESFEELIEQEIETQWEEYFEEHPIKEVDWREIIYQMAKDYYQYNQEDDFHLQLQKNNGYNNNGELYYVNGVTGYEQYYTDIQGFWRTLYNTNPTINYDSEGGYYIKTYVWSDSNDGTYTEESKWVDYIEKDMIFDTECYLHPDLQEYTEEQIEAIAEIQNFIPLLSADDDGKITCTNYTNDYTFKFYRSLYGSTGYGLMPGSLSTFPTTGEYTESFMNQNCNTAINTFYYRIRGQKDIQINSTKTITVYTQWSNKLSITYALDNNAIKVSSKNIYSVNSNDLVSTVDVEEYLGSYSSSNPYWNKAVYLDPSTLLFWFDFLDSESELNQFSVPAVGDRSKAVNDSDVKAIYFKETPTVIFIESSETLPTSTGYTYIQLNSSFDNMFKISSQGKSAKDVLDQYLYNYTYCIESVTINALPVYYLEPNVRISVYDENSQINGEYIVSKITLPLTYNGTMSITATKAIERLY